MAEALRSEDRNGILLLEAQKAKHRRRGGPGRISTWSGPTCRKSGCPPPPSSRPARDWGRVERAFRTMKAPGPPGPPDPPSPRAEGPRPPPDLHAPLAMSKSTCAKRSPPMLFDDERGPVRDSARRQGRALAAGQAESGLEAHELRRGRPRLPGTARAARNARDEPDRALGAGKAGIRRSRLADAGPETGAEAAERERSPCGSPLPARRVQWTAQPESTENAGHSKELFKTAPRNFRLTQENGNALNSL